ncbi:MAG: tyrosine-type recombinase/integrase [Chloroflexota bacterium]
MNKSSAIVSKTGLTEIERAALAQVVGLWCEASSDADTPRHADLVRDKTAALLADGERGVMGFYAFTGKHPADVTELDVKAWQAYLEAADLSAATVYAKVSRLSAFYTWLLNPANGAQIPVYRNPVTMSRPKAPKAYQNDSTQALSDAQVKALMGVVKADASDPQNLAAKRDYALLRFYFATGKRREEIARLTWGDLKVENGIVLRAREKGGKYRSTEIADPGVKAALYDYLRATGRMVGDQPTLTADDPLWLRHDRAAKGVQAVTSHGFVYALKRYAQRAGIGAIHLHQTRHTVADVIGNELGDVAAAQTVLGHENQQTTREYLKTVAVKKDKYSGVIAARFGFDEE